VASVALCVCVCVRTLKEKRLELSTPNLVDTRCMTVVRHALALKSRGQRSRSQQVVIECAAGIRST